MSKFRFVAIGTDRIEQRPRLGAAIYLHEFLVDHQTDAAGNVHYGRAFGYAWIRAHWANAPPLRTLKRHMQMLRRLGRVRVTVLPFGQGMRVRLLDSVKWSTPASVPAIQLSLFAPALASITSGKAVSNLLKSEMASELPVGPKMAPVRGQKWPPKEVKKLIEETSKAKTLPPVGLSPVEEAERRELLRAQAETLMKKAKSAVR